MAILKEIKVLVRWSIAERGTLRTAIRCAVAGPVYIWHRIQEMRHRPSAEFSDFDRRFGVDTDGATNNTTYLRDLEISQPELGACGMTTFRSNLSGFAQALSASGRCPTSEFHVHRFRLWQGPGDASGGGAFRSSASSESIFRLELVAIARDELGDGTGIPPSGVTRPSSFARTSSNTRFRCSPTVVFCYNPCAEQVLTKLAENIRKALLKNFRPTFICVRDPPVPTRLAQSRIQPRRREPGGWLQDL